MQWHFHKVALHPLFPDRIRIWKCCAIEKNRKDWSRLICRLTLGYSNLSMFARVSCLSKPEKSKFTTRNTVIRALRMTTISKRWSHVRHCRLVFPCSSKWREVVSTLKFCILHHITRHSYHWMCQKNGKKAPFSKTITSVLEHIFIAENRLLINSAAKCPYKNRKS